MTGILPVKIGFVSSSPFRKVVERSIPSYESKVTAVQSFYENWILRDDISRSVWRYCTKLHSLVLRCQHCMSVNFHNFWKWFAIQTRCAKLDSETLLQQSGQFLRDDISWSVLIFCVKLHSLALWCQDCMSVNFHNFWRYFAILTRGAKLSSEALLQKNVI